MIRNARSRPLSPRALVVAGVLLAIFDCPGLGQETIRLETGMRMRVNLEEARRSFVATLVDVRPDTLVLGHPSAPIASTIPLPVDRIQKLEISTGRRTLAPAGAAVGTLLGAALIGIYNGVRSSQCFRDCADKSSRVWLGAAVGAAIGGASFAFIRVDRWLEIAVPAARSPSR